MRELVPISMESLRGQRRSLVLWALALSAISAMYISFYPSMGGDAMDELVAELPEDMVLALGYDTIGTAGGWVTSTVYGLLGPALLLIFAISTGARLIAGEEELGTLELEATAPIARRRILGERLATLICSTVALVAAITTVSWLLITALDMDVAFGNLLAGSTGLLLLTLGFGVLALTVGAASGRRGLAVGVAAFLAVAAFMFDALGPVVDWSWMSAVSPFSWYLGANPLITGFDWPGLAKLSVIPIAAATAAFAIFSRRDLRV